MQQISLLGNDTTKKIRRRDGISRFINHCELIYGRRRKTTIKQSNLLSNKQFTIEQEK